MLHAFGVELGGGSVAGRQEVQLDEARRGPEGGLGPMQKVEEEWRGKKRKSDTSNGVRQR